MLTNLHFRDKIEIKSGRKNQNDYIFKLKLMSLKEKALSYCGLSVILNKFS